MREGLAEPSVGDGGAARARRGPCYPGAVQVWKNPYLELEIDPLQRLVRQTRTAVSFPDLGTLIETLRAVSEQMSRVTRADHVLVQDMRAARGRNDEQFEAVMARERPKLSLGFRRVAILVATQVGKLQVQRYLDSVDSLPARVFLDEKEALHWLQEQP